MRVLAIIQRHCHQLLGTAARSSIHQRTRLKSMVSTRCQVFAISMATLGFLGSIIACGLPNWKVTAFIGANIVTSEFFMEGLWMNCVVQSTGQLQCKVYDSLLALPQDLQGARALVIIAIIVGAFGIILFTLGAKCTAFLDDESAKAKIAITSGVAFLLSGLLVLIPVCWTASSTIRNFYNPLLDDSQQRELGESLYIGWASSGSLLVGGCVLCNSCPPDDYTSHSVMYPHTRSVTNSKEYV